MTDSPTRPADRPRPAPRQARVVRTQRLSRSFVRVVLGGPGLGDLPPAPHADSYVKLVFLPASVGGTVPVRADGRLDLDAVRAALPPDDQPRQRSYTVRAFDDGELTLDMVVHGTAGVAGPWAQRAQVGDTVWVAGPGGAWSPSPDVASHLLIGDASALPAVAVALERLPADAVGTVVLEVPDPDDELPLAAPGGVEVRWVHEADHTPGRALVEAVESLPDQPGPVGAFLHGEAGAVRALRAHLRSVRGVPREHLSVSGYWRFGADDEGWRAGKRAWLAGIEEQERSAGLD
ncbi:siderophore-interacting protein [Cellulomonas soli]|uniref:siderophore-interacting protein n=1 Tax=Cellulomonas soli TaxID=931535 RepID=UPI003F856ABD